jgi:hypothetical protein
VQGKDIDIGRKHRASGRSPRLLIVLIAGLICGGPAASSAEDTPAGPIVLTQLPIDTQAERPESNGRGTVPSDYGDGARIIMLLPDSSRRVLTGGFHSASDPRPSFDGSRMLFAGKKTGADNWDIYEMELDTASARRITRNQGDCRTPVYQGTHYTIDSDRPWRQITFVSDHAGERNEYGSSPSTSLYSCRLDGTVVRRLTFNPSSDLDPTILQDGRLLFSSWRRGTLTHGLFVKLMPCVTADRLVVFVESDTPAWDGSGALASVSLARNLHSYRQIADEREGLFHSPSPLPDGSILVSRRPADGSGSHAVYRLDPRTGRFDPIFDDPEYHDVQARIVAPRPEPDGRSSVVSDKMVNGRFYCLNVHDSDLPRHERIRTATPLHLRVLEGLPRLLSPTGAGGKGASRLLQTRFLGEIPIEEDGSFNIQVPANIPIQLQLIDSEGLALRSCGWIWVRNRETRGCIGCHEDGERTPENRFVLALHAPSIDLTLPPPERRTVDFRRQVMPIISSKCATASCHGDGGSIPRLDGGDRAILLSGSESTFMGVYQDLLAGKYVHPGSARTSPLIWHLFGRNTSRPWDETYVDAPVITMSPHQSELLTEDEKRTFVEWVDLGAHSDAPGGEE